MKRLLAVLILLTGALWAQTVTPSGATKVYSLSMDYSTSTPSGTGYTAPWSTTWYNTEAANQGSRCGATGATSCLSIYTANSSSALYVGMYGSQPIYMKYNSLGYAGVALTNNNGTSTQGYIGVCTSASNASTCTGLSVLKCSNVSGAYSGCTSLLTVNSLSIDRNSVGWALSYAGGTLTLYVQGSSVGSVSDGTYTPTYAGVYQSTTTTSNNYGFGWFEYGTLPSNAAAPSYSPAAGNFTTWPQTVTITSSTSGATICYTTDGSTPAASTAGTCSHGTSISNGGTASISATANLQAIATESGYVNSGVTSGTYYLLPTISLAGGIYTSTQTATIGCPYSLCYYTVDGSTPTTGSSSVANGGTVSIAHTELLTVEAIGGSSNTQATAEYVLPNETALVTDNFQSYYNTNLLPGITQNQLPLDVWATNSAYKSLTGANSAWLYTQLDSVQGGTNVQLVTASGSSVIATRTNEGYPNNHGAGIYVHPTTSGAGVGVGCTTSNCVVLQYVSGTPNGSLYLLDVITSTSYAVLLANYSDPVSLQLYRIGCHVYALVNGATPSTWSTYYTVSGCTGGAPALYESASGAKMYNLSAYATAASSGYTPPTIPSPPFTDAMNTSGWTDTAPPWLRAGSGSFGATFGAQSDGSGGYAVGPNGVSGQAKAGMRMYEGKFNINQYATGTVDVNANDLNINNYFLGVLMQQIVPGNTANVGNISNAAGAAGFDAVAAYCGLEPGTKGVPATVCATKTEYCGTPYLHCTEVDPTNSPLNQVNTISGSLTTLMRGDKYRVSMTNNYVDVYCQQSSSPPGAWTASMTMTAGTTAIETNGMIWIASTSGTAGSTKPTFPPGASWSTTTYTGTTVSDGTGAWMYWGDACSTGSPHWTRVMHAYFPYLSNASSTTGLNQALGIGRPFIWGGGNNSPMFQNVTVGNVGDSGDPCSTAGACLTPTTWIPQSFIP